MAFRSCWAQSAIVLLYFVLIFINARIFDIILWLIYGSSSMGVMDPGGLTVNQLKQLLDLRGVSYSGYIEKKELIQLVKDSASVVEEELHGINNAAQNNRSNSNTSYFKGSAEFFEQVEESKDTIWLIRVIFENKNSNSAIVKENNWNFVCEYLSKFSIKTGIYNCANDDGLCAHKGWIQPLLLLSFPKNVGVNDKIILTSHHSSQPKFIIQWVREQITSRVQNISSVKELENDWLSVYSSVFSYSSETVKVLLLTHLLNPPLFFAALNIKFTGRIRFGVFLMKREESKLMEKKLNHKFNMPAYLIITNNQIEVYGKQKPQYINFKNMSVFLKVLQPEMNDVFITSLFLINMLACLKIFQILEDLPSLDAWFWDLCRIIWTMVSLNFWLLGLWVILVGIIQWPVVTLLCNVLSQLVQTFVLTNVGSLLIADYMILCEHPALFFASFALYCFAWSKLIGYVSSAPNTENNAANNEEQNWWGDMLPFESFFVDSLFRARQHSPIEDEIEQRIDNILSRLPIPNFWLQPAIPNDYIKDLPIWMFNAVQVDKEMETIKNLMDTSDAVTSHADSLPSNVGSEESNSVDDIFKCGSVDETDELVSASNSRCGSITNDCINQADCKLIKENVGNGSRKAIAGGRSRFCSECLKSKQQLDSCVSNIFVSSVCAICLDVYETGCLICGLPCGHTFHKDCIQIWLERDNHHCPICRWPAYKFVK